MRNFRQPRAMRYEANTVYDRSRGGKLAPVMAVPFEQSESGTVSQTINVQLDPIPGRLLSQIKAHVTCVFVPAQAAHGFLLGPLGNGPTSDDAYREMLLSGTPTFTLEDANELTDRMGVEPISINGEKKVSEQLVASHHVAVNYLRKLKYVDTVVLDKNSPLEPSPALLGDTVLERLNGVLDPEDRVNGAVAFQIPEMQLPISGVGKGLNTTQPESSTPYTVRETGGDTETYDHHQFIGDDSAARNVKMRQTADGTPDIYALLNGTTSQMSLTAFYRAERMDDLTRTMRQILDANPEQGHQVLQRYAAGLKLDLGGNPFILYDREITIGASARPATDGPSLAEGFETTSTNANFEYTLPVPATEFGGIVITFLSVKPDENLARMPHPILTKPVTKKEYPVDIMALDPVPVTMRELDSEIPQADENNVAFYVGHNALNRSYVRYGLGRNLDPTTVENKSAIWQLDVPLSVTPETVVYPEEIDHYIFADHEAGTQVVHHVTSSLATINTPTVFGPTPVEEMPIIETSDLFGDAEE